MAVYLIKTKMGPCDLESTTVTSTGFLLRRNKKRREDLYIGVKQTNEKCPPLEDIADDFTGALEMISTGSSPYAGNVNEAGEINIFQDGKAIFVCTYDGRGVCIKPRISTYEGYNIKEVMRAYIESVR